MELSETQLALPINLANIFVLKFSNNKVSFFVDFFSQIVSSQYVNLIFGYNFIVTF